ncbi:MAG TPA: hypothetical protein VFV08_00265, partial [Puia sp.]|nr:hypothetical protein [Puia sp.]
AIFKMNERYSGNKNHHMSETCRDYKSPDNQGCAARDLNANNCPYKNISHWKTNGAKVFAKLRHAIGIKNSVNGVHSEDNGNGYADNIDGPCGIGLLRFEPVSVHRSGNNLKMKLYAADGRWVTQKGGYG